MLRLFQNLSSYLYSSFIDRQGLQNKLLLFGWNGYDHCFVFLLAALALFKLTKLKSICWLALPCFFISRVFFLHIYVFLFSSPIKASVTKFWAVSSLPLCLFDWQPLQSLPCKKIAFHAIFTPETQASEVKTSLSLETKSRKHPVRKAW